LKLISLLQTLAKGIHLFFFISNSKL